MKNEWWEVLRREIEARIAHLNGYGSAKPQREELRDVLAMMRKIEEGKRGEALR